MEAAAPVAEERRAAGRCLAFAGEALMLLPLLETLLLMAAVLAATFFAAAETALTSLPRLSLRRLAEERPKYAAMLKGFESDAGRLLTTIIVSSSLAVISFSFLASALTAGFLGDQASLPQRLGAWGLSLLASTVMLLAAEIAPKVVAKRQPEAVALAVLPLLGPAEQVLGPLVRLLMRVVNLLSRPFGGGRFEHVPVVTEEEIRQTVAEGEREGVLEKEEREMIHSIISFGDTLVKDVMVPRTDMVCISASAPMDRIGEELIECGFSRVPVYQGHFNNIIGVLYAKDFLAAMANRDLIMLEDCLRPVDFLPETKKVAELLREFKRGHQHIALVVDEFGGTAGLVTMEDLLEEIVGEIHDEYDAEERLWVLEPAGSYMVDARAPLTDLNAELGLGLPEDGEMASLGGFMVTQLGRVPRKGEGLSWKDLRMSVLEGPARRLLKVRVWRASGPAAEGMA
jgi:putative hemolysin